MPFPPFLVAAAGSGGARPSSGLLGQPIPSLKLALSVQHQCQANWCWTAVATSVALFYQPGGNWTQCTVASTALGRSDCCGPSGADPSGCNQLFYLDLALMVTGHFASMRATALTVQQVSNEISGQRPVGCRIEWPDGSGHFLAVVGVGSNPAGDAYIEISDPIFLDARVAFHAFPALYQGGAMWTHSYFTDKPAALSMLGGSASHTGPLHPDAIGA